ncbi:DnaJ domain-containing protein [Aggregatilineales bacterium SYSU G02658]
MDIKFDPYTILGLSRHATIEEIKKAYRRLVQRLHPDKNPHSGGAALQFKDVQAAYDLLSDDSARARYDQRSSGAANDTYFTLRVTPSKRVVLSLAEEQVMYLLAEIFPAPQIGEAAPKETYINLTLILDVSNSMKGPRIERLKMAAQRIIDELSNHDVISVVVFNDRATVIVPAVAAHDKAAIKARISMINASGGTEIFKGLQAGIEQNRIYADSNRLNSVILLTDGHTFGDQDQCLQLANEVASEGIVISAMGLGSDWNDQFLDELASSTGGSSAYISSADMILNFFKDHIKSLSNAFAERLQMSIAPDPDIRLDMAFRLMPSPQPYNCESHILPLSSLQANRPISVLLQFTLPPNMPKTFRTFVRIVVSGEILQNVQPHFKAVSDVSLEVSDRPQTADPPAIIMEALSKLTLYRLQEKARDALEKGDIDEATRRLQSLATRLLELGNNELAQATMAEVQRVQQTRALSNEGRVAIKYQTRALLQANDLNQALSAYLSQEDT